MVEQLSPADRRQAAVIRFDALTDYDLQHLVTHLAAAAREHGSGALHDDERSRPLRWMLELLTRTDFALAQAARMGPEVTVQDFITADGMLRHERPGVVGELALAIATATIVDSAAGAPTLRPDTLHALFGYRLDTTLYAHMLSLVTEEDLLERLVPDRATRDWLAGGFLHSSATRYRRQGGPENLERARNLLLQASSRVSEASGRERPAGSAADRVLSSVLYDLGYIDFLTGEVRGARDRFRESADAARRAGDITAYYMSGALELLVGFYDRDVTADGFRDYLEGALRHFGSVKSRSPHGQRWVMNSHAHLFDIACLSGDADGACAELGVLEQDPWVVSSGQPELIDTWRARYRLLAGDCESASELYAALLSNELKEPVSKSAREGAARDLLDFGSAQFAMGRAEQACELWERGLRCPDHAANWPWKPMIATRLATARGS